MKNILVCLEVPVVHNQFDLFVPIDLEISVLVGIIAEAVAEICKGHYGVSGREMLVLSDKEVLFHPNKCLQDYQVQDGARMMLI